MAKKKSVKKSAKKPVKSATKAKRKTGAKPAGNTTMGLKRAAQIGAGLSVLASVVYGLAKQSNINKGTLADLMKLGSPMKDKVEELAKIVGHKFRIDRL
jgi:hypothetical protein